MDLHPYFIKGYKDFWESKGRRPRYVHRLVDRPHYQEGWMAAAEYYADSLRA